MGYCILNSSQFAFLDIPWFTISYYQSSPDRFDQNKGKTTEILSFLIKALSC